jgi:metallo-beta-lactamase class B
MKWLSAFTLPLVFAVSLTGHAVPTDWTTQVPPFKISGNLYYVGSRDLASYLVVTSGGNILVNANLASSPPQIRASVEKHGFRWADTKIVLISQAHYDHVSGVAEVLRETHALYMVMDGDVSVVESGGVTDFDPTIKQFPPTHVDRILHDNDTVRLGGTTLVAHKTAGHTRGCTTWTMQTHEAGRTLNVVIVGGWSLNPGLLLVPSHGNAPAYPGIASDFDHAFMTFKILPCDIFLGAHGVYFDFLAKLGRLPKQGASVWIDPVGYREAVAAEEADYRKEFAHQRENR